MRRFPSALVALPAVALVSTNCLIVDPGCGTGGASILITPSVVYVGVGQSTTPRASWCREGHYNDMNPQWSLGSAADATIIGLDPATGRITGKRTGSATVVATYAGVSGSSVTVTVR